jgi:hypothetical protein
MTDVQQAVPVAGEVVHRLAGECSDDATKHLENRSPLNRAIYKAVREFRLTNMCYSNDPSDAYPLVDLMSNPAPSDIGTGEVQMIALVDEIEIALNAARLTEPARKADKLGEDVETFQDRVQPWMMTCFGEMIAGDREERNHRFLEEALELVQSCGCSSSEAHQLVDYVYGRDVGDPPQEVGGVMVTLAALCLANGLDMHANGETELARIWTKVEAIRAKQAAKPKHSPLPQHAPDPTHTREAELRSAIVRDLIAERRSYKEDSPTWRAFGFCIDIAEKALSAGSAQ